MAGEDRVVWSADEIVGSGDMTDDQALRARNEMDAALYRQAEIDQILGQPPTTTPRSVVLGGLTVQPSGTDVAVQPGALLEYAPTLAPVPGPFDSPNCLGFLRIATKVTMPSPGATSYVVVEARVVALAPATGTRLIWSGTMGVPTVVPIRQEYSVEFQAIVVGVGTIPAFTGGDWIPIAIVRRPGGGGAVALTDIYDIRPTSASRFGRGNERLVSGGYAGAIVGDGWMNAPSALATAVSGLISLNVEGYAPLTGERLWASVLADDTAKFLETGLALASNQWVYVYLVPFRDTTPVNAYGALGFSRGLVVISGNAPVNGLNNTAIVPPAPWNTAPAAPGLSCPCVAMIQRNAANTGWNQIWSHDGKEFFTVDGVQVASINPIGANNDVTPAANSLPGGIASWRGQYRYVPGGAAPLTATVKITAFGAVSPVLSETTPFSDDSAFPTSFQVGEFDVPVRGLGAGDGKFRVVTTGAINAGSVLGLRMTSFRI